MGNGRPGVHGALRIAWLHAWREENEGRFAGGWFAALLPMLGKGQAWGTWAAYSWVRS